MAIPHNIPAICLDEKSGVILTRHPDRVIALLTGISQGIEPIYSERYLRKYRKSEGDGDQESLCGTVSKDEGQVRTRRDPQGLRDYHR